MTMLKGIHHVAYRCKDAKETVLWYEKMLNFKFQLAIAEDRVPSTKEPDPYMHVFLDVGGGNVLAFFELPTKPPMGRDPNTPEWVQHIAFRVKDRETLLAYMKSKIGHRPVISTQIGQFLSSLAQPLIFGTLDHNGIDAGAVVDATATDEPRGGNAGDQDDDEHDGGRAVLVEAVDVADDPVVAAEERAGDQGEGQACKQGVQQKISHACSRLHEHDWKQKER